MTEIRRENIYTWFSDVGSIRFNDSSEKYEIWLGEKRNSVAYLTMDGLLILKKLVDTVIEEMRDDS